MATSPSFAILATSTASTLRMPEPTSGRRGTAGTNLSGIACTPLDPIDPEIRERMGLESPHELLQTFVDGGQDIRQGDIFVVGSASYPIRAVGDWYWRPLGDDYVALILEDLK